MQHRVLAAIAFACSVYLCVELVTLGIDKYYYILASGNRFPTFFSLPGQVAIGSSYLALNAIYLIWLWQRLKNLSRLRSTDSFGGVLRNTAPFLLLSLLAYPLGNDVYLYLHTGLVNLSHVNPFLAPVGDTQTLLSPFVDWVQSSTYGPISQTFFTISALTVFIHPILAVYVFKACCFSLHLLNGYLVWRLVPVPYRYFASIAYLLHPLLLFEQVASAHVDVFVSTSLLLFAVALLQRRSILAFSTLWAGLLAKTLPFIWMPLTAVLFFRQKQWRAILAIALLSSSIIAVLSFTVLPGLTAWRSLFNPGVAGQYQSSMHSIAKFGLDILRIFIPSLLTQPQQDQLLLLFTRFTLMTFALIYAVFAAKIYLQPNPSDRTSIDRLLMSLGWATLLLFLLATPWLMPWYASILITFAAVFYAISRQQYLAGTLNLQNSVHQYRFIFTSLAFNFSSSAQYLIQGSNTVKSFISVGVPIAVYFLVPLVLKRSLKGKLNPTVEPISISIDRG